MVIHVTQSHIDRGYRGDGGNCPVALAIVEQTDYICLVESDQITLSKYIKGQLQTWVVATSLKVRGFIDLFDRKMPVEPFEFELDVEGVG